MCYGVLGGLAMTADEFEINLTDREIGACRCAYVEAMRLNRTLHPALRLEPGGRAQSYRPAVSALNAPGRSGSFNLNNFFSIEASPSFAMLACNLMSPFRQSVVRASAQTIIWVQKSGFKEESWPARDPLSILGIPRRGL
jgi:hypothetical protein